MNWATKRKLQYFGIIVAVIIVFFVIPFYIFIYKAPTCFDGMKNGDELGIDCGGACRLLCSAEIAKPISKWDPRIFKVSQDTYSVIAYLENPNPTAEALHAPYSFKLYDKDGVLITERKGETFIPKGQIFAVYEGNFSVGERVPTRATFSFTGDLVWTKNLASVPKLSVTNKALSHEDVSPRVDARITNESLDPVTNIELVAIIFDGAGNAIGASRTLAEILNSGESRQLVFTWPQPFETKSEVCSAPVDVALVLDRSGSMQALGKNPPQPLTDVKDAAISFVNQLHDGDQGSLISFSTTASSPIDMNLTKDFSALKTAIQNISIGTNGLQETNIADGMLQAENELISGRRNTSSKPVMIVLTDGVANKPVKTGDSKYAESFALQVANDSKAKNIAIFTIGLGKDLNTEFLKQVASSSEEFYLAPTAQDLSQIYTQIATKICKKMPASIQVIPRIFPKGITPKP
jgi:Mg-chelatase subunit ChlD